MIATQELEEIAKSLMWWQEPKVSLERPARFLMQVMALGDWTEVRTVSALFGWDAFKAALEQAEPGVFDKQSWSLWHNAFGLPVPEMPKRSFMKEFEPTEHGPGWDPDLTDDGVALVASLYDVAATKMATIWNRTAAKDYLDIYAVLINGLPLADALAAAQAIYGEQFNPMISLRALSDFSGGDLPLDYQWTQNAH